MSGPSSAAAATDPPSSPLLLLSPAPEAAPAQPSIDSLVLPPPAEQSQPQTTTTTIPTPIPQAASAGPPALSAGGTLCALCKTTQSRYKCPSCLIPYCSLICYKPHKLTHEGSTTATTSKPTAAGTSTTPAQSTTTSTTTATDPDQEPFLPLLSHPNLKSHITSNPTLHNLLYSIYLSTLEPPPSTTTSISVPTNPLHKRRPPHAAAAPQQPWTPDTGIQKGVKKLSRVRNVSRVGSVGGGVGGGGTLEEFVGMVTRCVEVGKVEMLRREEEREAVRREVERDGGVGVAVGGGGGGAGAGGEVGLIMDVGDGEGVDVDDDEDFELI
ncbi:hypothetical protein DFH27DRAFT_602949 [Peziza echinospora]|nr:hypothetical protein DFH27DRAFT_602949 [Peziza echinospora]